MGHNEKIGLRLARSKAMTTIRSRCFTLLLVSFCALTSVNAKHTPQRSDDEFGPVVRAYLGYLKNEQEAVDQAAVLGGVDLGGEGALSVGEQRVALDEE